MKTMKWILISALTFVTIWSCKKSDAIENPIVMDVSKPLGNVAYIYSPGKAQILIELLCESINCSESGTIEDYSFTLKKGTLSILTIKKSDLGKYKMIEMGSNLNVPGGKIFIGHWAPYGEIFLTDVPELGTHPDSVVLKLTIKTALGIVFTWTSETGTINIAEA